MDLDFTLFVQLGLLGALIVWLKPWLFVPMLQVIQARQEQTAGARDATMHLEHKAYTDRQTYEEILKQGRQAAQAEREALRQEAEVAARNMLAQARANVADRLATSRKAIALEEQAVSVLLQDKVQTLSAQIFKHLTHPAQMPNTKALPHRGDA